MFLDTVETVKEGVGFTLFGKIHLVWLLAFVVTAVTLSAIYRRLSLKPRNIMRITVACLIIANEIFKVVCLLIGGRYNPSYLPLHLCSVNIFLILFHIFKRSKLIENFLYVFCIPASIIALLTPSWVSLPLANFMHIHSFTVHILLGVYPIMLIVGKDIRPTVKYAPKCILLLLALSAVALVVNLLFDTNFMFLMRTDDISFLVLFENLLGNHRWAFPILLPLVLVVMYLPVYILNRKPKTAQSTL